MNVEYTGRQFEVTPITRKQVEGGLEKIQKILGSHFETHVILSTEKRRHIAEITITVRNHPPIVGLSEAPDMSTAIGGALDKIARQAVKYKTQVEEQEAPGPQEAGIDRRIATGNQRCHCREWRSHNRRSGQGP